MPEDNPLAVSALLEWMGTGDYKHNKMLWMEGAPGQASHPELLNLYLALATIANKCGCEALWGNVNTVCADGTRVR